MPRRFTVAGLLVCLAMLAATAVAQVGHPAKGSWLGFWGPDDKTQHRLLLNLDWKTRAVSGQINPGPNAANISRAEIDYTTWTMTIEAMLPRADGHQEKWVATGKIDNLGSWTSRRFAGTYVHGTEKGSFKLALQ
jgi:hypothetical protein